MLDGEACSWELDHLLIWVAPEAPESTILNDMGLRHTGIAWPLLGRGTAAAVYLFENAYLALAWVDNPALAALDTVGPGPDLLARADWWRSGASPFGVGLRPASDEVGAFPLPSADPPPHLVPPGGTLRLAHQSKERRHPLYYGVHPSLLSRGGAGGSAVLRECMSHPLGVRRLTGASLTVDAPEVGSAGDWLSRGGMVSVRTGDSPSLELTFDANERGLYMDLRPTLPLKIRA